MLESRSRRAASALKAIAFIAYPSMIKNPFDRPVLSLSKGLSRAEPGPKPSSMDFASLHSSYNQRLLEFQVELFPIQLVAPGQVVVNPIAEASLGIARGRLKVEDEQGAADAAAAIARPSPLQ